jgi:hypothetical protein
MAALFPTPAILEWTAAAPASIIAFISSKTLSAPPASLGIGDDGDEEIQIGGGDAVGLLHRLDLAARCSAC